MKNFFVALIGFPFMMALKGFVLSKLWLWFIVPLGVVAINIPTACAISLIVTLLTAKAGKGENKNLLETYGLYAVFYVFVFLIGYLLALI